MISDYCCTEEEWSADYAEYVAGRGYHLVNVPQYGKVNSGDIHQKYMRSHYIGLPLYTYHEH